MSATAFNFATRGASVDGGLSKCQMQRIFGVCKLFYRVFSILIHNFLFIICPCSRTKFGKFCFVEIDQLVSVIFFIVLYVLLLYLRVVRS